MRNAGVLVLVMPWGPVIMVMGFVVGALLGFSLSLANDVCRLRRRQSAATKQCVRPSAGNHTTVRYIPLMSLGMVASVT